MTENPLAGPPESSVPPESPGPLQPPEPPQLPAVLLDPRPAVAAGFAAWVIATIVFLVVDGPSSDALPTCYAGLVIGALGTAVFVIQRRAARSGRKGAQRGLV